MAYVYMLSDYGEDGAENVTATLDRSRLLALADENWPDEKLQAWRDRGKMGLAQHLERSDAELAEERDGWNCHFGWGGMQLHVIELK